MSGSPRAKEKKKSDNIIYVHECQAISEVAFTRRIQIASFRLEAARTAEKGP